MKETDLLDLNALTEKAKASKQKEACKTIDRNQHFRISVCVRVASQKLPFFFVEVVINLSPDAGNTNLDSIEKGLACLKELQANNYGITTQDSNSISCEKPIAKEDITKEYAAAKAIRNRHLKT